MVQIMGRYFCGWYKFSLIIIVLKLVLWVGVNAMDAIPTVKRLEKLNVHKDLVTMSGFSSGGTFAQQMYVSYSSLLAGIAVFSHTYYRCGYGTGILADYDAVCTTTPTHLQKKVEYNPNNAVKDIRSYLKFGLIDDPKLHMANKPLYVFTGTRNYLFTPNMSLRILHIFKRFINNKKAIKVRIAAANLTLPSNRKNLPECEDPTNKIQISNCGFSGAFDSLRFLLGSKVKVIPPKGPIKLQPLLQFDQTEFFDDRSRHDMDGVGYFYVPTICHGEKKCLLHFYFHGCSTGREFVGPHHILKSGFLEVAETNGIIMIFPQAASSIENRIGCWDTFGLTGKLYATQVGSQVTVVKNMMDRILIEPFANYYQEETRLPQSANSPYFNAASSISQIVNAFTLIPKIKCSTLSNCMVWKG